MKTQAFWIRYTLLGILIVTLVACQSNSSQTPTTHSLSAFESLSNTIIRTRPMFSEGNLAFPEILGLKLNINASTEELTLSFVDKDEKPVGTDIVLKKEANSSQDAPVVRAENQSLFGAEGLTIRALLTPANEDSNIIIEISRLKTSNSLQVLPQNHVPGHAKRQEFIDKYTELKEKDPMATGVELFACVVQYVFDQRYELAVSTDDSVIKDVILDDLVDIFVNWTDKDSLMLTDSAIGTAGLVNDGPIAAKTGFREDLQLGEGRFRHFAANARIASFDPLPFDILTNLAARATGGDFEWLDDPTGDIAADLATNALGREFYEDFVEDIDLATLANGSTVKNWIIEHFGDGKVRRVIEVSKIGTGTGTISSSPAGIDCGDTCKARITVDSITDNVTFTAVPEPGSIFVEWSGACNGTNPSCSVTMQTGHVLAARFEKGVALTVSVEESSYGQITSDEQEGKTINCGENCSQTYSTGTTVTLNASLTSTGISEGAYFAGWEGSCSGTDPKCILTLNETSSAKAIFKKPDEYKITTVTITDPAGHLPFTKDPISSQTLEVKVYTDNTAEVTGSAAEFVSVKGEMVLNSIIASGQGTVAGFPNTTVKLDLEFEYNTDGSVKQVKGKYVMGADGGLPGGQPITFDFNADPC